MREETGRDGARAGGNYGGAVLYRDLCRVERCVLLYGSGGNRRRRRGGRAGGRAEASGGESGVGVKLWIEVLLRCR